MHQLELDFTAKPAPPRAPAEPSTASTPPKPDEAEHTDSAGRLATLLGQVVGDIVSDTLEIVLDRQEQRFVQMLEHQDARFAEMLDRQAKSHAADMTWIAEMNAENLRTILREVIGERSPAPVTPPVEAPQAMAATIVEVVEDLQETLRLGFGEIRAGLTRHHNELMAVVRSEIRPLAQAALARLIRDAQEPANAPQKVVEGSPPVVGLSVHSPTSDVVPVPNPANRPGLPDAPEHAPITSSPLTASSPPLTLTQWQHVHAALGDGEGDEDDLAPDDDARPPLRYHPPDDALAHAAEASP